MALHETNLSEVLFPIYKQGKLELFINEFEKELIELSSMKKGFSTMSDYIRYLIRCDMVRNGIYDDYFIGDEDTLEMYKSIAINELE